MGEGGAKRLYILTDPMINVNQYNANQYNANQYNDNYYYYYYHYYKKGRSSDDDNDRHRDNKQRINNTGASHTSKIRNDIIMPK